jgi:hypothetical protein
VNHRRHTGANGTGKHVPHDAGKRWTARTFSVSAHSKFTAGQRAREGAARLALSVHPYRGDVHEAAPGRYRVALEVR